MRTLSLSKSGLNKVKAFQFELKSNDFEGSVKSLLPGEWISTLVSPLEAWVGYINPMVDEKFSCCYLLEKVPPKDIQSFNPEMYLEEKISNAMKKRMVFKGYEKSGRLIFGGADGLPGLIVDQFENGCILQINTAGMDRFREKISQLVSEVAGKPSYFLDNQKYRDKESLPTFSNAPIPDIQVIENDLKYSIRATVLQKVGFYFDHRENRHQLLSLLERMNHQYKNGLDLFCYAGAWGTTLLKAGLKSVCFVDQGDFSHEVSQTLKLNSLGTTSEYVRKDVFAFVDEIIAKGQLFDVVICDPPAFAKNPLQKSQALDGYSKLHRKVFKTISNGGIIAFSSCTHYVTHDEFQKNILDSSHKENKKIQLLYSGMQGFDHPVSALTDRGNYIKCYFYLVESL